MSQDPYPPLRPQPPVRDRRRPTPWPTILGVALLGILAIVLLAILIGGDSDDTADATPTPTASSPGASSVASEGASAPASGSPPSGTAAPGSASTGVALERDSIVAATVEELAVRAGPGTSEERLGSLASGTPGFVVDGPVDGDGYRWYLLSGLGLPPNSGCAGPVETDPFNCPIWFGWVASASQEGEAWLTDDAGDSDACAPAPVEFEEIVIGVTDLMRLHCFGSEPFTFRAWWPEIPDSGLGGACLAEDEPSGWLLCQNINNKQVTIDESEGWGGIGLEISIDPASDVTMPEPDTWIELRVHLDDPASQGCDEAAQTFEEPDRQPEQYVLDCRTELVVESATAVDGP